MFKFKQICKFDEIGCLRFGILRLKTREGQLVGSNMHSYKQGLRSEICERRPVKGYLNNVISDEYRMSHSCVVYHWWPKTAVLAGETYTSCDCGEKIKIKSALNGH